MIEQFNTAFRDVLKLWPATWASGTVYALGNLVKPTSYANHIYKCTTAGTSGGTQPTWGTTDGGTTADGTGTLVWTCFDKLTYNVKAPDTATLPYVTFGMLTNMPIGTFDHSGAIEDITFYVNCFTSTSQAHVMQIADLVKTACDDATLTITGYTAMKCIREFVGNVIYDADNKTYQIPMRYRVWGDKN